MKKRLRLILPLLLAAIAAFFLYRHFSGREDGSSLRFSGNIEVTEALMSFRIAGRLQERPVDEGERVLKGQLLAKLDKSDQLIGVALAEANLAYAAAVLAELEAGSRREDIDSAAARALQAKYSLTELQNGSRAQEIESSRAARDSAMAASSQAEVLLHQAKLDYDRFARLFQDGSVSKTIFENAKTQYETAQKRVEEAHAGVRAAREQLDLIQAGPRLEQIGRSEAALQQAEAEYARIKAGPRKEAVEQARAKASMAEQSLKQAKQLQDYTELTAPMDAVVLSTAAEPGEYLNPASPVLTLGRLDKPWLRAYIHEEDLGRIKLNQKVTVSTDAFAGKQYTGQVSYISSEAEFTPKTVQTFEERVKLMYRIKVTLDNQELELKPGMPADGTIDLSNK